MAMLNNQMYLCTKDKGPSPDRLERKNHGRLCFSITAPEIRQPIDFQTPPERVPHKITFQVFLSQSFTQLTRKTKKIIENPHTYHTSSCFPILLISYPLVFFSSSVADVALKARSLYERKHKKKFVQGHKSIGLGKSIKPTHNHKKQQKNDDPQIPQPDLRFASGETKQTAKPKQTQNGARAQTEHPRNRFAKRCSGFHCIICKSLPNELHITASSKHGGKSRYITFLHVPSKTKRAGPAIKPLSAFSQISSSDSVLSDQLVRPPWTESLPYLSAVASKP